jgi:hypothetical protein
MLRKRVTKCLDPRRGEMPGENKRCFMICTLSSEYGRSRMIEWAVYAAHTGNMRNNYKIVVGKSVNKRPFESPRSR